MLPAVPSFGHSFLRGLAGAYDLPDSALRQVGPALTQHLDDARARWPGVVLSGEDYAEHLARCAPLDGEDGATEPAAALAEMHTEDLYLARACAEGSRAAIESFEKHIMSQVPRAIARVDSDDGFMRQIMEDVRVKLLVGDGGEPRILRYLGRGPLSSWVQVTGIRAAYSHKRRRGKEVPLPSDLDVPLIADAPELARLREQIEAPFRRAFLAALAELTPRERTILRLYLIEEVSAESIGTMYKVHRATVARWIHKARRAVHAGTRKRLQQELDIGAETFESLMGALLSRLDVSLASFLDAP